VQEDIALRNGKRPGVRTSATPSSCAPCAGARQGCGRTRAGHPRRRRSTGRSCPAPRSWSIDDPAGHLHHQPHRQPAQVHGLLNARRSKSSRVASQAKNAGL
jgi:hypothetical protein